MIAEPRIAVATAANAVAAGAGSDDALSDLVVIGASAVAARSTSGVGKACCTDSAQTDAMWMVPREGWVSRGTSDSISTDKALGGGTAGARTMRAGVLGIRVIGHRGAVEIVIISGLVLVVAVGPTAVLGTAKQDTNIVYKTLGADIDT